MIFTPRDPQRIDRIIELLREVWKLDPDSRLTQLLINASDVTVDCSALYYIEDDEIEQKIQSLGRQLQALKDSQEK